MYEEFEKCGLRPSPTSPDGRTVDELSPDSRRTLAGLSPDSRRTVAIGDCVRHGTGAGIARAVREAQEKVGGVGV